MFKVMRNLFLMLFLASIGFQSIAQESPFLAYGKKIFNKFKETGLSAKKSLLKDPANATIISLVTLASLRTTNKIKFEFERGRYDYGDRMVARTLDQVDNKEFRYIDPQSAAFVAPTQRVKEILEKATLDPQAVKLHSASEFCSIGKNDLVFNPKIPSKEAKTQEEFDFLIAHEIGHIKKGHYYKKVIFPHGINMIFTYLIPIVTAYGLSKLIDYIAKKCNSKPDNRLYQLLKVGGIGSLLYLLNPYFIENFIYDPAYNWCSRRAEIEADLFGAQLVGPKGGISALSHLTHVKSASCHPSIQARIANLETYAKNNSKNS